MCSSCTFVVEKNFILIYHARDIGSIDPNKVWVIKQALHRQVLLLLLLLGLPSISRVRDESSIVLTLSFIEIILTILFLPCNFLENKINFMSNTVCLVLFIIVSFVGLRLSRLSHDSSLVLLAQLSFDGFLELNEVLECRFIFSISLFVGDIFQLFRLEFLL
jgi:hypothetical protein